MVGVSVILVALVSSVVIGVVGVMMRMLGDVSGKRVRARWSPVGAAALVVLVVGCSSGGTNAAGPSTTRSTGSPTSVRERSLAESTPQPHPQCLSNARKYTPAELDKLVPAVYAMVKGNAFREEPRDDAIVLGLYPGREKLAAVLEARFGNAVRLSVGLTPYHCGIGSSPRCPKLRGSTRLPPGLHLTLQLGAPSMNAAASQNAHLVVREDGSTPFTLETGQPLVAMIVKPGTRTVVGMYGGAIAGTGLSLDLRAGQHRSVQTIVTAWRCDGGSGSTLPVGTYGVRAGLGTDAGPTRYVAPEVPLRLTRPT